MINDNLYTDYKYWIDYRILWTKLFYIKSERKSDRNWKLLFSEEELKNMNNYVSKFGLNMKILIFLISHKFYFFANLFIDLNNFIKRPYSK